MVYVKRHRKGGDGCSYGETSVGRGNEGKGKEKKKEGAEWKGVFVYTA